MDCINCEGPLWPDIGKFEPKPGDGYGPPTFFRQDYCFACRALYDRQTYWYDRMGMMNFEDTHIGDPVDLDERLFPDEDDWEDWDEDNIDWGSYL